MITVNVAIKIPCTLTDNIDTYKSPKHYNL